VVQETAVGQTGKCRAEGCYRAAYFRITSGKPPKTETFTYTLLLRSYLSRFVYNDMAKYAADSKPAGA